MNLTSMALNTTPSVREISVVLKPDEHHGNGCRTWGCTDGSQERYPELDGEDSDPIVICGFSINFPDDATSAEGFWEMLEEKRCAMKEFPPSRLNIGGFYQGENKANSSLVAGCNLTFAPETYVTMTNLDFLSTDSRCYSFDHRAQGYSRGEGLVVIVLKRLSDAIRNDDVIRAVIRSTGCNEDGKTPGITQPSAHGTGTAIGDPREAQAIGFRKPPMRGQALGLRRASVNSFGYGGANSHIVLDDAYNYMRLRSLKGRHNTDPTPRAATNSHSRQMDGNTENPSCQPRLMVWSAADQDGIARMSRLYNSYFENKKGRLANHGEFLADLAYTLGSRRSSLSWRSFAVLDSMKNFGDIDSVMSTPVRVQSQPPRLGYVFSGQGAQWCGMAKELVNYPSFRAELHRAGAYLRSMGCLWSVNGRIRPSAVVGHSSGEIAAAYAGGHLTEQSAWKLAYFRGLCL
ncbi:hypothetical protein DL771_010280 [Monosporascus sp. 5C6A]|nr:hypothetical protein DL771_010280 [Monosporascus sp. 5C6A]